MRTKWIFYLLAVVLGLSACSGEVAETSLPAENVTPVATVRRADPMITKVVSNGIVTFTDSVSGISLDYPEGWIMDQVRGGTRSPSVFVFTNYRVIPSLMDKIGPDETVIYLTIPQPVENGSLASMIDSYRQLWEKESSVITSEKDVTLKGGQPGKEIIIDSYLGQPYYYLFTQVGETLVFIEAYGALDPIPAIALTIR